VHQSCQRKLLISRGSERRSFRKRGIANEFGEEMFGAVVVIRDGHDAVQIAIAIVSLSHQLESEGRTDQSNNCLQKRVIYLESF
jgi:hypothetical protein